MYLPTWIMVCSHCPTPSPSPLPTPSPTTMGSIVICRTVHTEPTPLPSQTPTQMQLGFIPVLSADNSTDNMRNNGFKLFQLYCGYVLSFIQ